MEKRENKQWMKDPLRFAMTAHLDEKTSWAMGAALCALFLLAALKACAAMQGAAVIAVIAAVCAGLLMLGAWKTLRGEPVMTLLCAALLCMLAVGAHLAMLDIRPGRMANFLEPMLGDMWNYELVTAAAWEDDAWSGVYLFVMALFSRLETFPQMYAVKLFDMVCQCAAALAVLRLAKMRGAKPMGAVAAMLACVLAPTMLFNAGLWAQCDATFATFTLWGLALLLDDHPLAGCVLWGLALGTKLQSAFLFPLLIVMFMNRKVSLRHLLVLFAAFVLSQMAFVLDGQGIAPIFTRYAQQLEMARYGDVGLADNAPGVFGLMIIASVREFSGMGLYFGIACALLVVFAMLRARGPLDKDTMLLAALLLALGLPLVLPQMNARSLYLAGMLAFAAANSPKRLFVAGLLELISICTYTAAIFNAPVLPIQVLSLLAIGAAVVVALELIEKLKNAPLEAAHEEEA